MSGYGAVAIDTKDSLACLQSYHRSFVEYSASPTSISTGRGLHQQQQQQPSQHHQPAAVITPSDAYRLPVQYPGIVQTGSGFPAVGSTAGYEAAMNSFFEMQQENFRREQHQYRSNASIPGGYEKLSTGAASTATETKRRSSLTSCDNNDNNLNARSAEGKLSPCSGNNIAVSGSRNSASVDGRTTVQQSQQPALNSGMQQQQQQQQHQDALQGLIQTAKVKIEDQTAASTPSTDGTSRSTQQQRSSSGNSPSKNQLHSQHVRVSSNGEVNSKTAKGIEMHTLVCSAVVNTAVVHCCMY
jgi:hypothetical protein